MGDLMHILGMVGNIGDAVLVPTTILVERAFRYNGTEYLRPATGGPFIHAYIFTPIGRDVYLFVSYSGDKNTERTPQWIRKNAPIGSTVYMLPGRYIKCSHDYEYAMSYLPMRFLNNIRSQQGDLMQAFEKLNTSFEVDADVDEVDAEDTVDYF